MKWIIITGAVILAVVALALTRHFSCAIGQEATGDWPPEVKARLEASRALRAKVQSEYPKFFLDLQQCLFRHDPVGINFETNSDEYDPEVGTIIPRLPNCKNQNDVLNVVHEEFVKWFGADNAGPKSKYTALSKEIWKLWSVRGTQQSPGGDSLKAAPQE